MRIKKKSIGELLQIEITQRGITQRVLAKRTKTAHSEINNVIKGNRTMSLRLALELEILFIKDAKFWLTIQLNQQIVKAKSKDVRF